MNRQENEIQLKLRIQELERELEECKAIIVQAHPIIKLHQNVLLAEMKKSLEASK